MLICEDQTFNISPLQVLEGGIQCALNFYYFINMFVLVKHFDKNIQKYSSEGESLLN